MDSLTLRGLPALHEDDSASTEDQQEGHFSSKMTSVDIRFRYIDNKIQELLKKMEKIQECIEKFRRERDSALTSAASNEGDEDNVIANQTRSVSNAETVSVRFMRELECICCYDKMTVPVFQCLHGHLICNKCHRRLKTCPVCREVYTSKPIRCRLAEALVEVVNSREETSTTTAD